MRKITLILVTGLLLTGLLALAGCGDDDSDAPSAAAKEEAAMKKKEEAAMKKKEEAAMKKEEAAATVGKSTTVTVGDSEFGETLFDSNEQAIYIFENDSENKSACYGECAAAWPPVLATGEPKATQGVDASLLGTTKRRDGSQQVTYAGQPLYFYANEGPGEVRCHNVDLNGGFWWAIGPDGERLPS